jgi:NADH dehydrogenase
MTKPDRVLIIGATGRLGGTVARRLVAQGTPVRALARDPSRVRIPGVEAVRGDLLDAPSLRAAMEGVTQVFTSANSFMGKGASSPTRVDLAGYQNVVAAARDSGVSRLVHISAYGLTADTPVDYFRVKFQIDQAIMAGGVPWVLLRASAFMDIWVDVLAGGVAKNGTATVFGDGTKVSNYIAIEDVADYVVRVLARPEIRNEVIDLGGPSTLSDLAFAELVGRHAGRAVRIRRIPVAVLRAGAVLLRPFNEVAARLMAMGAWSATRDRRLDHWRAAAERFGVAPLTVEAFLQNADGGE